MDEVGATTEGQGAVSWPLAVMGLGGQGGQGEEELEEPREHADDCSPPSTIIGI